MKNLLLLLIMVFVSVQCKTSKEISLTQDERILINTNNPIQTSEELDYEVVFVSLNGNVLNLTVKFQGENAIHSFDLLWSGMVMRSMPPRVNLILVHKISEQRKTGKKSMYMDLVFNITPLIEKTTNYDKVVIGISGYNGEPVIIDNK